MPVNIIAMYFILNGNIYLAPNVHSVVTSRVLNVMQSLKSAIDVLDESVKFSVDQGYQYGEVIDAPVMSEEAMAMHKALYSTINNQ